MSDENRVPESRDEFLGKSLAFYAEVDLTVLGTSHFVQPAVWLKGETGGDEGRASGSDPVPWTVHCEDEGDAGVRCRVIVDGELVADINVRLREGIDRWREAPLVSAALVWGRIRAILRDRARTVFYQGLFPPSLPQEGGK